MLAGWHAEPCLGRAGCNSGNDRENAAMSDYTRLVFTALHAAGSPDAGERARIYAGCRTQVASGIADEAARTKALEKLEKVIRRQEMQAIYEETLNAK